jgi:hypothetical protein
MSAKEPRSREQLTAAIMAEVRQHPDWNDIVDVGIIRPVRSAQHHPNWDAAFVMDGPRVAPEPAFQMVRDLQNKFDLA